MHTPQYSPALDPSLSIWHHGLPAPSILSVHLIPSIQSIHPSVMSRPPPPPSPSQPQPSHYPSPRSDPHLSRSPLPTPKASVHRVLQMGNPTSSLPYTRREQDGQDHTISPSTFPTASEIRSRRLGNTALVSSRARRCCRELALPSQQHQLHQQEVKLDIPQNPNYTQITNR